MTKGIGIILLVFSTIATTFAQEKKPNIVFILSDDHRYNFMGFTGAVPGLKTPHMDKLAEEGAHLSNAFVSTALCSPSRASILTGQYAHTHTIVDNSAPLPEGLTFFPQYLQELGYKTGFFGKWHMGNTDDMPQPGFDQWVSFRGQGTYYDPTFNINGERIPQPKGAYTSDLLTEQAIGWLESLDEDQPFMLYLSHKAVHAEFEPAERHKGMYDSLPIVTPPRCISQRPTAANSMATSSVRRKRLSTLRISPNGCVSNGIAGTAWIICTTGRFPLTSFIGPIWRP